MSQSETGLTGKWIGRYSYHQPGGALCSFEAWLIDDASGLNGETVEPNSFAHEAGETLMAVLSGAREGAEVSFTKTYTDIEAARIAYAG